MYLQNDATPLIIAARDGHLSVVALLIQKGATIDLSNKKVLNSIVDMFCSLFVDFFLYGDICLTFTEIHV